MLRQRKKSSEKTFSSKLGLVLIFLGVVGVSPTTNLASAQVFGDGDPLILEPVIQNFYETDYAYAYEINSKLYISISQVATWLGFAYEKEGNQVKCYWSNTPENVVVSLADKTINVDGKEEPLQDSDFKYIENELFVSNDFLKRIMNVEAEVEPLAMQLKLDSPYEFPTTKQKIAKKRRSKGIYHQEIESFKNYSFDERLFGTPVADLTIGKGWAHYENGTTTNNDSYSLNLAGLVGGMDVNAYIYGDSYDDRKPKMRISASREFINEPKNPLNMKKIEVGDLNGVGNSYFASSASGRGISASSFKNLVTSADKTIDITGPLQDGWQVELYWNDQLLGYRQNGKEGQYSFPNIPVSYGLNTFKLVFYGPYGEVRTEEKRYYSGTSPVKQGEFGYTFAAYQPDRYIVEVNEPFAYDRKTSKSVVDLVGYYGLSDNLTLMGGYTETPDVQKVISQNFGMTGLQYAIDGLSLQYNLERNFDNDKTGHHIEAQGDVRIGTLYAAIDDYNGIHSPVSEVGGDFIKNSYEMRLSGMLPYSIPYYLSWRNGRYENSNYHFDELFGRLSKQVGQGVNLTLENSYFNTHRKNGISDDLRLGAYKWWGAFTTEAWLTYRVKPDNEFKEIKLRGDWRTGRRTYISGEYTHDLQTDMDYLSLSGSKVFSFGGLSLSMTTDRDFNFSTYLTYNVSLAKEPGAAGVLYTGNSRFSDTGSLYVNVKDEFGQPLEGVGINANGLEREVYTDENGNALLSDLQTYEKTNIRVNSETLPDIALQALNDEYKLVLRPGTIRTLNMPFVHKGAVEGQLFNPYDNMMFGYMIAALDANDNEIGRTFADTSGMFILDDLPYGTYKIVISKDGHTLAEKKDVKVDDISIYLEGEILLDTSEIEEAAEEIPEYLKEEVVFEATTDDEEEVVDDNSFDFYDETEGNFAEDEEEEEEEIEIEIIGQNAEEYVVSDDEEEEEEEDLIDRINRLKKQLSEVLAKVMDFSN